MPRKCVPDRLNVLGVSAHPKMRRAIAKAARSRPEIVQDVQVATELAELPGILEQIDVSLHTLVFLHHLSVQDPELARAFEQIHAKAADVMVWFVLERWVDQLPDEFRGAGAMGTLSPTFTVSRLQQAFTQVIDSVNRYCGQPAAAGLE